MKQPQLTSCVLLLCLQAIICHVPCFVLLINCMHVVIVLVSVHRALHNNEKPVWGHRGNTYIMCPLWCPFCICPCLVDRYHCIHRLEGKYHYIQTIVTFNIPVNDNTWYEQGTSFFVFLSVVQQSNIFTLKQLLSLNKYLLQ